MAVDIEILRRFVPLQHVQSFQLEVMADSLSVHQLRQGELLFRQGDRDEREYFLLHGAVGLTAPDGKSRRIDAGSELAAFALARLRPRQYTAKALSDIEFFTIDRDVLAELSAQWGDGEDASEHLPTAMLDEGQGMAMLESFEQDLRAGRFELPSLPEVALRIQTLLAQEDSTLDQVARCVNADPVIAAKLIKAANSPIFRAARQTVSTESAIQRLGFLTTRHLVTSFALKDLFQHRDPRLRKLMIGIWQHSLEVAALSAVFAEHFRLCPSEQALLTGLIHDIGKIAILAYAANHPALLDDGQQLQATLDTLRAPAGAEVLRRWGFPEPMVQAALHAEDWYRAAEDADLCDLVIVAQWHALMHEHPPGLPKLTQLPAFVRLSQGLLSPELAMQILREAKDKLAELHSLLAS